MRRIIKFKPRAAGRAGDWDSRKFSIRVAGGQQGMASIVIITVLIVLLSLITVGFSVLMNRSVNNALNNQLSVAATYAARSGINDVVRYIENHPSTTVSSSQCSDATLIGQIGSAVTNLSSDGSTKLTCMLVDPSPPDVAYTNQAAGSSRVVKLNTATAIDQLMVSWQATDSTQTGYPPGSQLLDITSWNYAPLVRTTLYAIPKSGQLSDVSSKTFFLFPTAGSATFTKLDYGSTADGSINNINCGNKDPGSFVGTADYQCNMLFTGLSGGSTAYYYIRLTPVYNQTNFKLQGNDASNKTVTFQSVQTVVDVTAKAGSAVKRLQERINTDTSGDSFNNYTAQVAPENALRSAASICKRLILNTSPVNTTVDGVQCGTSISNPPAPVPVTGGHGTPTQTSVTVAGTVNPKGYPVTDCRFVYQAGTASGLSKDTPTKQACDSLPGSGNSPVAVGATLSGLSSGTTYYYALCAANDYNDEVCDTSQSAGSGSFTTPRPPASFTFSANPTSVNSGSSSTLSWTTSNVDWCWASGGWSGWQNPSGGRQSTGNLTSATSYTLNCDQDGKSGTPKSLTVSIAPPPASKPTVITNGFSHCNADNQDCTTSASDSSGWIMYGTVNPNNANVTSCYIRWDNDNDGYVSGKEWTSASDSQSCSVPGMPITGGSNTAVRTKVDIGNTNENNKAIIYYQQCASNSQGTSCGSLMSFRAGSGTPTSSSSGGSSGGSSSGSGTTLPQCSVSMSGSGDTATATANCLYAGPSYNWSNITWSCVNVDNANSKPTSGGPSTATGRSISIKVTQPGGTGTNIGRADCFASATVSTTNSDGTGSASNSTMWTYGSVSGGGGSSSGSSSGFGGTSSGSSSGSTSSGGGSSSGGCGLETSRLFAPGLAFMGLLYFASLPPPCG